MTQNNNSSDKTYELGYQVYDVSPLPHYFEEVYGHTKGIAKIGPRGDYNYFWYSKKGNGSAYYEVHEQALSAASTYEFFEDEKKRKSYIGGAEELFAQVKAWSDRLLSTDLKSLSTDKVFEYADALLQLDADIFSYYLISQPYRLMEYEQKVRWELRKRVATVKIDDYLARLVASPQITENAKEELQWSKLILEAKDRYSDITEAVVRGDDALLHALQQHFDEFKLLNLGDGTWSVHFEDEIARFVTDAKKSAAQLEKRIEEIEVFPETVADERARLIEGLELPKETVETINFLSEMSHLRYMVRVQGFVPLIYFMIQVTNELAQRVGYQDNVTMSYLTHEEFHQMIEAKESIVPLAELQRRRGDEDEYMVRVHDGVIEYHFGKEAGELFASLVPPVDHASVTQLQGVAARHGHVQGTATVYQWGDDMAEALRHIEKHPILVAGQTRPAMMPLIRLAQGIVTDEGGVTSHAAIVARELGIPTIINTTTATKVFANGDMVDLDADTGIVRKMEGA